MKWNEDFIDAKYHLAVVERMLVSYREIGDKRFLVGIINESAKAVFGIVFFVTKRERFKVGKWKKRVRFFLKVASKYFDKTLVENLIRILEIKKAQEESPVEYAKGDKIILLIRGKYRILTFDRIEEFIESIRQALENFRQV